MRTFETPAPMPRLQRVSRLSSMATAVPPPVAPVSAMPANFDRVM